ncbi:MAG TPA: SDR family NAD(P)-dependent oxidoreductase [candidate division Zixibacteria bacterium]|nr:SDR family NAD(P)-dependent oxidoreductase [candidate division Zixibacteria bacterium]
MQSIAGKVTIVTGASRGIGRAIALCFAKNKSKVVISARNKKELEEVAAQIKKEGGEAFAVPADMAQESQIKNLVSETLNHYGGVDIVVNNAGLGIWAPVAEMKTEDFDATFIVNLRGVFLMSREVIPHFIKKGGGQIINIASVASKSANANLAAYCASKAGLVMFSESLALEIRNHNIKVTCVSPGSVASDFGARFPKDRPTNRPGLVKLTNEEVAEACLAVATQNPNAWTSELILRPLRTG